MEAVVACAEEARGLIGIRPEARVWAIQAGDRS